MDSSCRPDGHVRRPICWKLALRSGERLPRVHRVPCLHRRLPCGLDVVVATSTKCQGYSRREYPVRNRAFLHNASRVSQPTRNDSSYITLAPPYADSIVGQMIQPQRNGVPSGWVPGMGTHTARCPELKRWVDAKHHGIDGYCVIYTNYTSREWTRAALKEFCALRELLFHRDDLHTVGWTS